VGGHGVLIGQSGRHCRATFGRNLAQNIGGKACAEQKCDTVCYLSWIWDVHILYEVCISKVLAGWCKKRPATMMTLHPQQLGRAQPFKPLNNMSPIIRESREHESLS
jgi:hypothetical protein